MVKINDKICPPGRTIYAKCEFFNPLSAASRTVWLSVSLKLLKRRANSSLEIPSLRLSRVIPESLLR
jgi:hypothetical protein